MATMNRESRERKPSALYNSDALNDKAFTKVLREYQKQKVAKRKDVPVEHSASTVAENPKPIVHKQQTGKTAKHGGGRGRKPAHHPPVMSPQAVVQHEIEERHIAACREVSLKSAKPRKVLPEGAVELEDLATAVKRGVKETSTLLLDWSSKKAQMIGNLCKVYWDGEDTWFYARILNYDSYYGRHYIYYLEDSTAEWIDLENEIVLVAAEMVLARLNPGGAPWAAQRYWVSEKAHRVCHNFPGFHKGGEYVEYLSDQPSKEYAFLQRKCLDPMQDKYMPSKQSAAFKRSMKAAESEQQAIDEVIEAVQNAMQDAIFGVLHGDQWLGHRVRAATHRIVQRGENRSHVLEQGSAYSVGTIRRHRPSTGEHLVVFDDPLLQPQWVACRKSTIDVLLGANAARADGSAPTPAPEDSTSSSTDPVAGGSSDVVTCGPCGAPGSTKHGHEGVDYTHQKDCVLCASSLDVGTVKQCEGCHMKCHTYCAGEETSKAPSSASSSSTHHWGTSAAVPWKCWNCIVCYGCAGNSWDKALLAWNVRRIEPEAPDLDILVCGDCLYRYKYVSDFCPSCFKLYAVDESMLPLVPAPPSDAAVAVVAPVPEPAATATSAEVGGDGEGEGDEAKQCDGSEQMEVEVEEAATVEGQEVDSGAAVKHGDHQDGDGGGETDMHASEGADHGSDHEGEGDQGHDEGEGDGDARPSAPPLPLQTGLSEDNMVECNECSRWVHAHCEGIDQAQYDAMTLGTHPIWGNEYLCPLCRVKISQTILRKLADQDKTGMFAEPVTERVARNYHDIIRHPMDMTTMRSKAARGQYKSLQPLRQDFELMCLNAIVFNRKGDEYWREARRFFEEVERLFRLQKRQTQVSAYGVELQERVAEYEAELEAAKAAKSKKRKGAQGAADASAGPAGSFSKRLKTEGGEDQSTFGDADGAGAAAVAEEGTASSAGQVESKDGGAVVAPVSPAEPEFDLDQQIYIPSALAPNPDPVSYLPCSVVSQSIEEAYHLMSHDRCLVCGCSGRAELLLFCVDCGEAVHSFCAEAPLSTMPEAARASWRCMNCKICQVCHTNTENETVGKMLYCEGCDFAYHSQCLTPKVSALPEGSWFCADCVQCTACALLAPDGKRHPCWGVDLAICFACHERAEEQKRAEEARVAEQARLDMLRDAADNCNVCFVPHAGDPVLMCTVCGRNSHVSCNSANAVPMPKTDLESYRDFMCRRCVDEYLPSCASHVGTGASAALLLQCVARIQRKRWAERQQARERKLAALEQERRCVFEAFRPALKAMVVWGALRAQWFLSYHPTQAVGAGAQYKAQLNFGSARALRFMAVWKRKTSACGLPLSQRRAHLLQGLDEDGQELSPEKVVRVASLAAAFIEATNTEVRTFVPKAEELEPVLQFANTQAMGNVGGSDSRRPVFTVVHLEECLEKLCRQPIGFDSGELPLAFCGGVKLFSEGQQLPSKTLQFTHGGAVALPWLPGNVARGPLLTIKSRPGYQYKIQPLSAPLAGDVPPGSGNSSSSATAVGGAPSAVADGGAMGAPPRCGAAHASMDAEKMFKDPVSVNAVYGEGYYARKARQFGLVPKVPLQPKAVPIPAVLRSPQVTLMASALELVARDIADGAEMQAQAAAAVEVRPMHWDVSRMDLVTRQVFDTIDWMVKKVEVRNPARLATGHALAAAHLQRKEGVQRAMDEISHALGRVGDAAAVNQAAFCFSCEPFNPAAYTFAASPVTPSHGSRLLPVWQDPRSCYLCLEGGEDGVTGRLLPNVDGTHVHSNCLRWSPDIVESEGVLRNAKAAKDRAMRTSCFFCSRKGATVCCTNRKKCRRAYHLRCAMLSQCLLMETMPGARSPTAAHELQCFALCPEHVPAVATEYPGLKQLWQPYDPMRPLLMDENRDADFTSELLSQRRSDKAVRSGSLTVLNLGKPLPRSQEFYNAQHIYAHRFKAARIFWSGVTPLERTLYLFEILQHSDLECLDAAQMEYMRAMLEQSELGSPRAANTAGRAPATESPDRPIFRVVALDNAAQPIFSYTVEFAFRMVVNRARACNPLVSASQPPAADLCANSTTAHQFFGLSVPFVRKGMEMLPEAMGMMISLDKSEPRTLYAPVYCLPAKRDALVLQQQLLRSHDGLAASVNGCARADGYGQLDKRIVGKRVTRILAKVADADPAATKSGKPELNKYEQKDDDEENKRVNEALRSRYQDMTAAYLENPYAKLDVRKSGIHGWGLFAKINFEQNDIIVEYIGQKIRQVVADKREVQYEEEGVGSCYLFRLDKDDIIDATRRGGMARFINHCCEPNAYARVISAPAPGLSAPDEKHIIIMAARDIQEGEEVTYDYKFPIEDDKLKCYCGAPRCGGFMN